VLGGTAEKEVGLGRMRGWEKRTRGGADRKVDRVFVLTSFFLAVEVYRIVMYVYFCESIFEEKSIHIVFTFANLTT
jgi:hypothetical protein